VVVETVRGIELGHAAGDLIDVEDSEIEKLKSPLRPVLRIADEADLETAEQNNTKAKEAMATFRELAAKICPDMHPVSIEFLLDGDKAVFYFESEKRIDFRDLVKQLAAKFKVRVDMRQMGVRDEARIIGGIGHCGQEVCCRRLGGEFKPVSIRMAKDQGLSLNPQKISGLCGRLMCCLRYEDAAYKDFAERCPKMGTTIDTPDGEGKVIEINTPRETVKVKVGEEKPVVVKAACLCCEGGSKHAYSINQSTWEDAKNPADVENNVLSIFQTSQLTGTDKLATPAAVHHERSEEKEEKPKRRRSRSRKKDKQSGSDTQQVQNDSVSQGNRKRRRRTKVTTSDTEQNRMQSPRPGQKSSSLGQKAKSQSQKASDTRKRPNQRKSSSSADSVDVDTRKTAQKEGATAKRRPRRTRSVHVGDKKES
jgi:cell fate regulator YaaT (PSP1 superfamily)